MTEQKLLSSQGTEVNKHSTSYTSVESPQKKKKRKRKKRKIKKGSGARLITKESGPFTLLDHNFVDYMRFTVMFQAPMRVIFVIWSLIRIKDGIKLV